MEMKERVGGEVRVACATLARSARLIASSKPTAPIPLSLIPGLLFGERDAKGS